MQLTANEDTLVAIRTLVGYLRDDEQRHYVQQLEDGEGDGHIYQAIAQIERWLSGQNQVLHMVTGDESFFGFPWSNCEILTAEKAAERFQAMLEDEDLPPLQYNPETDKVLAFYVPTELVGYRFYGFTPLVTGTSDWCTELTFNGSEVPQDRWQVEINDEVVYQQSEEEEEEEEIDDCASGSSKEDCSSIVVEG